MRDYLKFYIDGAWVDPVTPKTAEVINPATEEVSGHIALGSAADVDKAVAAARKAFESWSQTSVKERLELLLAIQAEYAKRMQEIGEAVTEEMGWAGGGEGNHQRMGSGTWRSRRCLKGGRRPGSRACVLYCQADLRADGVTPSPEMASPL